MSMTDVHLRFGELDPDDVRLYPAGPDAGGGTFYARSTADTARAGDTLTRTLSVARGTADLARAVDVATRALVAARSTNDTAPATDTVDAVVAFMLLLTRARLRVAHRPLTQLVVEVESCPSV